MKLQTNVFRFPALRVAAVTFALALSPCAIWAELPTIDNFQTGLQLEITAASGSKTATEKGSMIGGEREVYLGLSTSTDPLHNEFNQKVSVEVETGDSKTGVPGAFVVSPGYDAYGEVQLIYGSSASPLNVSLAGYDAIRVTFNGVGGGLNFNMVELDSSGTADSCGVNLGPGTVIDGLTPFSVDFPFSAFTSNGQEPSVNWSDIRLLLFEFQAVGNPGIPTFAITNIEAIVESANPPAAYVCPN